MGTRYGPVPTVPPSRWGPESSSVPVAVGRGWGAARHSSARPVPSVMRVAFNFPSVEVEEEEKDKENIPAPDNVPRGAIAREFAPARAQGTAGRVPGDQGG